MCNMDGIWCFNSDGTRFFIPCVPGQTSDGYHTRDELYHHRNLLFIALLKQLKDKAWFSKKHADGSEYPGWFIAGVQLSTGDITYHLPSALWDMVKAVLGAEQATAPEWDGHTSYDVCTRLSEWALE